MVDWALQFNYLSIHLTQVVVGGEQQGLTLGVEVEARLDDVLVVVGVGQLDDVGLCGLHLTEHRDLLDGTHQLGDTDTE